MSINWLLVATIFGPVVGAAIGSWATRWAERRPKLVTYYGHVSAFTIANTATPATIHTHEVVILNNGGKTANNVRLGHQVLPMFQINPPVEHRVIELANDAKEILFPTVVPREQLTISYLYFPPTYWNQVNTYVKSDEGMAQVVTVLLQRQYPRWFTFIAVVFFLIGLVATLYLGIDTAIRLAR